MTNERLAKALDATILGPSATIDSVRHLHAEVCDLGIGAICVPPAYTALVALLNDELGEVEEVPQIVTVANFPFAQCIPSAIEAEMWEIAVSGDAHEIDVVMPQPWQVDPSIALGEMAACFAHVNRRIAELGIGTKLIMETAAIAEGAGSEPQAWITRVAQAAVAAGFKSVKTSTGFSPAGGANKDHVAWMAKAVGPDVGVKASGGIRDRATALQMIEAGATRVGTSSGRQILTGQRPTTAEGY